MKLSQFKFELPINLIAQHPAKTREESRLMVIDRKTGKILWQFKLPAAGYASPSVYAVNGKQYVVIACGGGKLKSKSGDRYLAFALP